jgi:4-aminobutyrate aminotransferase-like enzyme
MNTLNRVAGKPSTTKLSGQYTLTSTIPVSLIQTINVKVSPPGAKSREFLERMKKVIGRSNYVGLYGIVIANSAGAYIVDLDGNVYLDCLAAASCNILGYKHREVAKEYYQVAKVLQNSCFPYSPNLPAVELAEHLVRITPGDYPKKVLLGLSGSDSCDGAIEAMRKYTHKLALIKFKNDYHGSTGLSQAASGFKTLNLGIYPASHNFITVNYPITLQQRDETVREIEHILAQGKVGGVMAEPIQGDAGIIVPYPGFFPRLKEIIDRYQALLIVDEVQSGMGRTGKWWAIEHENVIPDILVTAKGLSAGYAPISALIGREEIIDSLAPAQHLFTYTGHPPSAATASKVIQIIEEKNIIANAANIGKKIIEGLRNIQAKYPQVISDVRGQGLMIGVEIDISRDKLAGKVFATRCVEKGVYVGYCGVNQNVIRIEPPLIITQSQADIIVNTINEVAEEVYHQCIPQLTIDKVHKFAIGL